MNRIHRLIRPHLLELEPYVAARHEAAADGLLRLDANENSWGLPSQQEWNRYPDPLQRELKAALASREGLSTDRIFVGNGSDEAIDLLVQAFCRPGVDQMMVTPPTYGMYATTAAIHDVAVVEVLLREDYSLDVEGVLRALRPETKLVMLCSPNNPSGNLLDSSAIEAILRAAPGLVVVDEAYVDFAGSSSWSRRLVEFENLVVLQTLSKAWGLANLRVGMAFGSEALIEILNRIKPPYNLSGFSQRLALQALWKPQDASGTIAAIRRERDRLADCLVKSRQVERVFPSDANFLLVRFANARAAFEQLLEEGVVVRDRSRLPHCANCLRITVGRPEENERLLEALSLLEEKT